MSSPTDVPKCVNCGKLEDTRMGWCFECAARAEINRVEASVRQEADPANHLVSCDLPANHEGDCGRAGYCRECNMLRQVCIHNK